MTAGGDREALLRRRRELQLQIRRDGARRLIANVLAALDGAGVEHEVVWPEAVEEAGWSAIQRRFPWTSTRLAAHAVPGATCERWSSDEERTRLFRALLARHAGADDAPVMVVWGNGAQPALRLAAGAAAAHCAVLLDAGFETWVFAPGGDWIIECEAGGELCAARA